MKLAEIYNKQNGFEKKEASSKKQLIIHMPEIQMLIKHLDLLYTKMLMKNEEKEDSVAVANWFNPGQGSVKQSESVN
tara:strand:+ start:614 stop:844 length:231 start_codon:yes stop_codon:yes gene_type:complete